jgi:hypothetical protein
MADVATDWRTNIVWRDDYVFWTALGVSKTACIGPPDEVLLELGRVLTREEAVGLYGQIRDMCARSEGEWRAEFLWWFPQVAPSDLPPLPPGERLDEYPKPAPTSPNGDPPPEVDIPF